MAVSLPTSTDVRKVREQQAEVIRTPLLALLGATDYVYGGVNKAVTDARTRANKRAEEAAQRVSDLPNEISELRDRLSSEQLRKQVEELREQAEGVYVGFAERGEKAWGRLRKQPQVKQAISTVESLTEKVDELVDDTHDTAEKALGTVTRETRSLGERAARGAQEVAGQAAEAVTEVTSGASKAVAARGTEAAAAIDEAGDEVASSTRSTARKAANRTDPKDAAKGVTAKSTPKTTAARKPATRRTTSANGRSANTGK